MLSTCCNVLYIYLVTLCPCTVSAPRSHNCRPGHRHAMSDVPGHQNEWFSGCQLAVRGANVSNGTGKTRRWHRSEHCGAGTLCNNTKNRKNRTGLNRGDLRAVSGTRQRPCAVELHVVPDADLMVGWKLSDGVPEWRLCDGYLKLWREPRHSGVTERCGTARLGYHHRKSQWVEGGVLFRLWGTLALWQSSF